MFRRMRRDMPDHEAEMTLEEPSETEAGVVAEDRANASTQDGACSSAGKQ